jgi:hypothetical protein
LAAIRPLFRLQTQIVELLSDTLERRRRRLHVVVVFSGFVNSQSIRRGVRRS